MSQTEYTPVVDLDTYWDDRVGHELAVPQEESMRPAIIPERAKPTPFDEHAVRSSFNTQATGKGWRQRANGPEGRHVYPNHPDCGPRRLIDSINDTLVLLEALYDGFDSAEAYEEYVKELEARRKEHQNLEHQKIEATKDSLHKLQDSFFLSKVVKRVPVVPYF